MAKEKTVSSILKSYCENSTIHGFSRIVSSDNIFWRLLWIGLVLGTSVYLGIQMYGLLTAFYSWPVKTSVSLGFSKQSMPAISICNMNTIKRSMLKETSESFRSLISRANETDLQLSSFNYSSTPGYGTNTTTTSYQITSQSATTSAYSSTTLSNPTTLLTTTSSTTTTTTPAPPAITTTQSTATTDPTSTTSEPSSTSTDPSSTTGDPSTTTMGSSSTITDPSSTTAIDDQSETTGNNSISNTTQPTSTPSWWHWTSWSDPWMSMDAYGNEDYYNMDDESEIFTGYEDGWDHFLKYAPDNEEFKMNERIKMAINNMTAEKRKVIGHQIKDMLIQCSFGNKLCSKADFKHFLNAEYGNCYTIGLPYPKVRQSGEQYGISLTLNVEKNEYLGGIETGYGIRLTIHDHNAVPFPTDEGMTLSAGYETYIGLKLIKIKRMSEPYGNCSDNQVFRKKFGIEYSVPVCRLMCLMEYIHETCECDFRTFMPDLFNVLSSRNASLDTRELRNCKDSNTTIECSAKARASHMSGTSLQCSLPCYSRCSENIYTTRSSGRIWPTSEYMKKIQKQVCQNKSGEITYGCDDFYSGESADEFKNNYLKVRIYFEDLNFETITEEPMYETVRFISDIGGTLGLFIGASMLSVAELACLLVALVSHGIRKMIFSKVTPEKLKDAPDDNVDSNEKETKGKKDSLEAYHRPLNKDLSNNYGGLPGSVY